MAVPPAHRVLHHPVHPVEGVAAGHEHPPPDRRARPRRGRSSAGRSDAAWLVLSVPSAPGCKRDLPACRARRHDDCPGGNWCDCQHRTADPTPPVDRSGRRMTVGIADPAGSGRSRDAAARRRRARPPCTRRADSPAAGQLRVQPRRRGEPSTATPPGCPASRTSGCSACCGCSATRCWWRRHAAPRGVPGAAPGRAPPRWRRAHGLAEYPTLVVVSGSLRPRPGAAGLRRRAGTARSCSPTPTPTRRPRLTDVADVLRCGDEQVDLAAGLAELRRRGLTPAALRGRPAPVRRAHRRRPGRRAVPDRVAAARRARRRAGSPPAPTAPPRRLPLRHVLAAEDGCSCCATPPADPIRTLPHPCRTTVPDLSTPTVGCSGLASRGA